MGDIFTFFKVNERFDGKGEKIDYLTFMQAYTLTQSVAQPSFKMKIWVLYGKDSSGNKNCVMTLMVSVWVWRFQ